MCFAAWIPLIMASINGKCTRVSRILVFSLACCIYFFRSKIKECGESRQRERERERERERKREECERDR